MKRVFVGLSGGVDSSVSAALLCEQGYEVTGVFIKIWQPEFIECTWREDRLDAMRVCAALEIPYREIDLSDAYKSAVVERMVASYERGITPNPDVLCNTAIKFGAFMRWALDAGADYVATGHYARSEQGVLLRGADASKDQSYFLHGLTSAQLSRIIFPIGALQKREVRARAAALGLPVAGKPDSQGLCFVGDISLPEFLSHYTQLVHGSVINVEGAVVGTHDGAARFTIGQRHGFTLTASNHDAVPHYVIATDAVANTITVSTDKRGAAAEAVVIDEMHWIADAPLLPKTLEVQARYRETPVAAEICKCERGVTVRFSEPHIAAPGQSLVLYDGDRCLGGGEISRVVLNT